MNFATLIFISLAILLTAEAKCGKLLHASCQVDYTFPDVPCSTLFQAIKNNFRNCCAEAAIKTPYTNYKLVSADASQMQIVGEIHFGDKYVDTQTFTLTSSGNGCIADGCSVSNSVSYYDYCANFCDTRNIVRGLGTFTTSVGKCSYVPTPQASCPFLKEEEEREESDNFYVSSENPYDTYCNAQ